MSLLDSDDDSDDSDNSGDDDDAKGDSGTNLLMIAARKSDFATMKYFIETLGLFGSEEYSSALNQVCKTTQGYFRKGVEHCPNFKCFTLLLNQTAAQIDVNIVDKEGFSQILHLCQNGKIAFVKYLISNNGKDGSQQRDGQNILHLAAAHNKDELIKYLLKTESLISSSILNAFDKSDRTPLMTCVESSVLKTTQKSIFNALLSRNDIDN